MATKVTADLIETVRSVVGADFSDMDIIRALHMANNDPTAAINIIFDTPSFSSPAVDRTAPRKTSAPPPVTNSASHANKTPTPKSIERSDSNLRHRPSEGEPSSADWWLIESAQVAGLSTCKGRRIKAGDAVSFTFPRSVSPPKSGKFLGRGRSMAAASCPEIVRFSTIDFGEIGRIPNEWARCLSPLVKERKVRVEGCCVSAPDVLGIMDTVLLSISVYINGSMFHKHHRTSLKMAHQPTEGSVVHPLPNLFRLLGLTPFKKAELTPEDLYTRKRPLDPKDSTGVHAATLPLEKCRKLSDDGSKVGDEGEAISDSDMDRIVGVADSSELEEMEPPAILQRGLVVYLNVFSGDATTEFPSTLEMARGGILADSMGLGKTIMTIALLLSHPGKGGSIACPLSESSNGSSEDCSISDQPSPDLKRITSISGFDKLMKSKKLLIGGGSLIVCPMTLLGQWKAEIETHVQSGSLSVYVHYGQSRPKDAKLFAQNDVVITTYGVLASEYSAENTEESGGLYSVHWFRIVLDEAHTIKSAKSQISIAAAALTAERRWCLTGTPIQNNVEDIYSLLRFMRVEPWSNFGLWNKLIQKPFEEGNERALKLIQSILRPIMLRRTKSSTDKEGKPILVLPPADVQVVYFELSAAEKDFYEALFKRSKVKFDQFVEQGREVVEDIRKGEKGECPICLEAFEDAVLTPCAHRLCRECLLASWRNATSGVCPVCRKTINRQDLITAPTESRFQIDVEKNWVESSKVSMLLHELELLRSSGSKSIVFSQWTAFLDLLQIPLHRCNFTFLRLDGTLNQQQRERVIYQFTEDSNISVLLMSLKAGGVGINLTAASNAFLMDPWWNPAVEEQAVMRIHRIGQTKSVTIKRFIVKGTVEERMEAVQARKQRMISGALTDQEVRSARIEELKMLFT
ncbi:hypothetical protein QJS10_CPB13g01709 [Acorus calamus]|uniref:Uncharacterized protein n=1 Tax=Acorus calamus TaxID=4465 RepID=A0AAV9DHH7_ACOCL|nr:hypothetical protein QJS10_CPB13g01709 [Acorus calamus]